MANLALFEWEAERLRKYGVRIKPAIALDFNGSKIILQWALEGKNGKKCPFLTKRGCLVYAKRPLVCRSFPFMTSGLKTQNLEKVLSNECESLILPFKKGERMNKQAAFDTLHETYNSTYSSAVKLDTAREWIKQLFEYSVKSEVTPAEKEIGLLELMRRYNLMDSKEIEEEIAHLERI